MAAIYELIQWQKFLQFTFLCVDALKANHFVGVLSGKYPFTFASEASNLWSDDWKVSRLSAPQVCNLSLRLPYLQAHS